MAAARRQLRHFGDDCHRMTRYEMLIYEFRASRASCIKQADGKLKRRDTEIYSRNVCLKGACGQPKDEANGSF